MAIKTFNPTTPGQRGMTTQDMSEITAKKPIKSLLVIKKRVSGRNNQGRITTRHRGGGAKQFYRLVNFKLAAGKTAVIEAIEYDPNRSARIARIKEHDGTYHYIIAAKGMKVKQVIASGEDAPIEVGNRLQLQHIPVGSLMPSGEVRLILQTCMASIGRVGNEQHQNIKIGKAGRNRLRGIRPSVRGVVMNAADHPHGGGDGGRHGTGKDPRTPWGQKTLGYKTRRRKSTNKFIVRSRHSAKRK